MSLYLDTSLVVSLVTKEVETPSAQAWLAARSTPELVVSDWVATEVSSALALKVRLGNLSTEERAAALAAFRTVAAAAEPAAIQRAHFVAAARLCDRHVVALRASDALHLALVLDRGDTLCTRDRRFAGAAEAHGAPVQFV